MEISEILKNSIVTSIELHALCLGLVILMFKNMRKSLIRSGRNEEKSLTMVYIGSILMIVSDCIWTCVSSLGSSGDAAAYVINLIYFLGSSTAAYSWFVFCGDHLETKLLDDRSLRYASAVPFAIVTVLYLLSPFYGYIFSIKNGEYIRGNLFYLDPVIKMVYVGVSPLLALISGKRKELGYLRKRDFEFALFGVPVIVCGILQVVIGGDFNCMGVAIGLILVYVTGITNQDTENTNAMYSLAAAYEASYIVNMDTGRIRPLKQDIMHDREMPGMKSPDYTEHFTGVLSEILLPEDKTSVLDSFKIENVAERFKIDSSFSIRYRVMEDSGRTELHMASFIHAAGEEGRQEFLLGINSVNTDSLLYERNEILRNENQRLEQINTSIIESVAKIVEARDGGSGEHIIRVRKLTEILARELMKDYPQFDLDEEKVKLISSASVLHDVGKIVIPDAVLLKPGRLTEEEFEVMKTHSARGCDMLNMFPLGLDDAFLEYALSICRWHHEKYDGKGYPDGLKGEEIPIAAQIVSAADCFDALVSDRPYKKAFPPEKAFEMILNGECGAFSPYIKGALESQKSRLMEFARLYR